MLPKDVFKSQKWFSVFTSTWHLLIHMVIPMKFQGLSGWLLTEAITITEMMPLSHVSSNLWMSSKPWQSKACQKVGFETLRMSRDSQETIYSFSWQSINANTYIGCLLSIAGSRPPLGCTRTLEYFPRWYPWEMTTFEQLQPHIPLFYSHIFKQNMCLPGFYKVFFLCESQVVGFSHSTTYKWALLVGTLWKSIPGSWCIWGVSPGQLCDSPRGWFGAVFIQVCPLYNNPWAPTTS